MKNEQSEGMNYSIRLQGNQEVVSSEKLTFVYNVHINNKLRVFSALTLLTTSPPKCRKTSNTGEGGK